MTEKTQRVFIADIERLTPDMMQIEKQAHAVPWSGQVFGLCFGGGYRVVGLYLISDGVTRMIGYSVVHKVLDELSLMNIAIAPEYRGKGFGRMLMQDIIDYACDEKGAQQWRVFLEVREGNKTAIAMYKSLGFTEIGRRPGYYQPARAGNPREDAVVMALE
ncbi:ribosomal-protein-alanine N-acetyltransferase [Aliidiomarina shirensis]|uniref:Ribosomal-protein-alanine N-acetyltransferase n=1 Tax=Aliidiomarina shirensis TaxID=1048642 RepID=A0A432WU63_9GAMM|nr:ribosomal protein S18-alanine N-acetyltransferase [Aliidiomarina shirensis]RUO37287.1 ribosomal-protein-alanine N-acetyltransferase [Aliidiomarina shirensis]